MDENLITFLAGIVGAVIGAAASIITTILASNSETKKNIKIEEANKKEKFRDFQRETCLELQECFQQFIRYISLQKMHDLTEGRIVVNEEEGRLATARVLVLTERLANKNLREQINEYRMFCVHAIMDSDSEKLFRENYADRSREIHTAIGEELRSFY